MGRLRSGRDGEPGLLFREREEAARERISVLLARLEDVPWPGLSRDWRESATGRARLFRSGVVRHRAPSAIPLGRFTWNHVVPDGAHPRPVSHSGDYETGITADGSVVLMDASLDVAGMQLAEGQQALLSQALERTIAQWSV